MIARPLGAFVPLLLLVSVPAWGAADRVELHDGWRLQTSRKVQGGGELVSTRAFKTDGWYRAVVPSTVVGTQVTAGEFPDPMRGMNMRKMPGMSYPIGINSFTNLPMPADSPYVSSWWYRTEIAVPKAMAGKRLWLTFQGINYRANVWANGRPVASAREVQGAYRIHELDVTSFLKAGEVNVLALETFAPTEKQLGINWVDWNPAAPDKSMGIWGDAWLSATGPVTVRSSQVVTHLGQGGKQADLTVMTELHNATDRAVAGAVEVMIDRGGRLAQDVTLQAGERRRVVFTPEAFPALRVKGPRLWWPAEMGEPALHALRVRFVAGGKPSDEEQSRFGIREVTSELTAEGHRLFRVNGRRILIRGAGWAKDMFLRRDRRRLEAELAYAQDMHLNTIRLEAMLEDDVFFDRADEKGLMIIAGWCCCDVWERWKEWPAGTLDVATEQLRTQLLRMRGHPSVIAWMHASDGPPPPDVERTYNATVKAVAWPNVVVSSAADVGTPVSGPSGVKMSGPYDYVPPSYWYSDQRRYVVKGQGYNNARFGGAFGFNTETGPGPSIPPLESLKKMLPEDHLWPPDDAWVYHSAGERFQKMTEFREAMNATYGAPTGLEDFLRKAQAMAYDGHRAMFEAHVRNKYTATGVIQWMLNNGWPSLFWHLYDYYLYPAGAYFGTKKANEPVHVAYSYDDRSVVVVNSRQQAVLGLTVVARAYDLGLQEIFSQERPNLDAAPDSATRVLNIPVFPSPSPVTFVKLSLRSGSGQELSSNFYWLPVKGSTMDWEKASDTAVAPIQTHEDLTALAHLPAAKVAAVATRDRHEGRDRVTVTVRNPGTQLAFMVHLGVKVAGGTGEVLPVIWEDNYLSLLPGESRTVTAEYLEGTTLGKAATVTVDGWNTEAFTVAAAVAGRK